MKFAYASGSKTLAGYTIKRGIGRGGFGEVYYATSDAGKEVALKLIQRSLDVELRGVTQCLNLKNPHLIEIYDIRESDAGESWIVMEYVGGDNLEAVIDRHPDGLPKHEALEWFKGIAAGVACLHDRGIVHRDLKPGNLFREDGRVKIGDYGLSKFITASRRSAQTESIGTVHYMAPEVARGKYGKEIDIYALGVILYEMLTGRVPFDGESAAEILMKHLTAEPDLRQLPEPFKGPVACALDKDPNKRFASVGDFVAAVTPGASAQATNGHAPVLATAIPGVNPSGGAARTNGSYPYQSGPQKPAAKSAMPTGPREPVARFVCEKWEKLNRDSTSQVIFWILVAVLFTMTPLAPILWGVLFWGAIGYCVYRIAWTMFVAPYAPPTPAVSPTAPTLAQAVPPSPVNAAAPAPVRTTPRQYESVAPAVRPVLLERVPPKSRRQSVSELLGSLIVGSVAAAALGVMLSALERSNAPAGA